MKREEARKAEMVFSAFPLNISRAEVFVFNEWVETTTGTHEIRAFKTISRRVYARTMKTQGQLKEELNKPESLSFPLHLPVLVGSNA